MLQHYFGFNEEPFGSTPDPRCLFASPTHREALASLKCGFLSNRGFTTLIAPPGMGKTTLLFRFLDDIKKAARTVFLFDVDSRCNPQELVARILCDLGLKPAQTSAERREQLKDVLTSEALARNRVVVVIDEAQNLSDAALEMVRLLTNFETARAKLMQIVLAGQQQLSDKLLQPSFLQLRQRISTICHLEPLSAFETRGYVEHRLQTAGYSGDPLFTKEALNLIAISSRGIPRTINTLCFNSLSLCRALKRRQVDAGLVVESIADQQLAPASITIGATSAKLAHQPTHVPAPDRQLAKRRRPWIPALAASLVTLVLGPSAIANRQSYNSPKMETSQPAKVQSGPPTISEWSVPETPRASIITRTIRTMSSVRVIVQPHQTLGSITIKHLGSYDVRRLRQIEALNPTLIDPNHIEAGQTLRLPIPLRTTIAVNSIRMPYERNLP